MYLLLLGMCIATCTSSSLSMCKPVLSLKAILRNNLLREHSHSTTDFCIYQRIFHYSYQIDSHY